MTLKLKNKKFQKHLKMKLMKATTLTTALTICTLFLTLQSTIAQSSFNEDWATLKAMRNEIDNKKAPTQNHPNCIFHKEENENTLMRKDSQSACDDLSYPDFAAMSETGLYNYLINISIGIDGECFSREIFFFDEIYSQQIFSEDKINYITDQAATLANDFTGVNNGLFGIFQYLYIAVTQNRINSLSISQLSWNKITETCTTLSSNPHILNSITNDANSIAGYLFATCGANNIPSENAILNLVQQTLYQHAELQNWKNFITIDNQYTYSYYFKIHFLLNTFLFNAFLDNYDQQNPKFTTRLNETPYHQIITSLAYLSCDPELKSSEIERVKETSLFAAKALDYLSISIIEESNNSLYNNHLESALLQVLNCSNYLDPVWVTTASALIDGGTDIGYDIEAINAELIDREFPNQHIFENGKLVIHSRLTDIEILGLYESIQQVKAQFFRLFELTEQMPVENDPNEIVQIRIYKNREAYTSFNNFLFGAPSSGGGVFIENANSLNEDYATIYTYDRDVSESRYTLEEVVRHDFTHYLEARYLIKGLWGATFNSFYENNRLAWFEEGLAEFFAGSSSIDGIIERNVIKNNVQNRPLITLQEVTQLGFDSSDLYNFGNLIWSTWYHTNRKRFKDLAAFTRQGESGIVGFDTYVNNFIVSDEQDFQAYIDCIKQSVCETWTPATESLTYDQFDTGDILTLENEFTSNIENVGNAEIEAYEQARISRFSLTGSYTASTGSNEQEDLHNLYNRLDEILIEIQNESSFNNFDYTTAYYSNVNTSSNPPSANFHISGPLKKEYVPVYPGDVNYDGIVNNVDRSIHYLQYGYNNNNIPRQQQGINWQDYDCADWGFPVPVSNYNDIKHFDCNGDGAINSGDKNAIILNWEKNHTQGNINAVTSIFSFGNLPTEVQIQLIPTGNIKNYQLTFNIVLERFDGADIDVYGGFFTVNYPALAVNQGAVLFPNSWLGNNNNNLEMDFKDFPQQQKIEIAFSRTDGANISGNGVIGQVVFSIDDSFIINEVPQILNFEIVYAGAHENDGTIIPISNKAISINNGQVICEPFIDVNENTPFQNVYNSSGTIVTDSIITVGQNQQIQYNATNRATLNSGFSVKAGAHFKVRSNGCD